MAKSSQRIRDVLDALQLMSNSERKRILSDMAKTDPQLVELLKSKLYSMEDLIYLSPQMFVDFLRNIDLVDFAMGLKLCSKQLQEWVLNNLSTGMRREVSELLYESKIKQSEAQAAQDKVHSTMKRMISDGSLVISKTDDFV